MKWKSSGKTRRSGAKLCEEAYQDAVSHEGEKILDTELRESPSTLNRLAHQVQELQEGINSLIESQDFNDLETSSCSGSTHAPGKPSVFPSFQTFPAATSATILTHGITVVCQVTFFECPNVKASSVTAVPTAAQAERSKAAARVFSPLLAWGDPMWIGGRRSVARDLSIHQPRLAEQM